MCVGDVADSRLLARRGCVGGVVGEGVVVEANEFEDWR
jgi:hypothetical protein